MTKILPPDPEHMNDRRAEWAAEALRGFQCETGTDNDHAMTDLLCDLMHWCDRHNSDFDAALSTARMHYEAETAPEPTDEDLNNPELPKPVSPIDTAKARTSWVLRIWDFDALEIHPCTLTGNDGLDNPIVEQCEPEDSHCWCVFGHLCTGGLDDFEDFATEAEAVAFHDRLIATYPHLADEEV